MALNKKISSSSKYPKETEVGQKPQKLGIKMTGKTDVGPEIVVRTWRWREDIQFSLRTL
jgi:hypothetical protein